MIDRALDILENENRDADDADADDDGGDDDDYDEESPRVANGYRFHPDAFSSNDDDDDGGGDGDV
jgi:hypothetical protein